LPLELTATGSVTHSICPSPNGPISGAQRRTRIQIAEHSDEKPLTTHQRHSLNGRREFNAGQRGFPQPRCDMRLNTWGAPGTSRAHEHWTVRLDGDLYHE
jgi:hypothetical protein